MTANDRSLANRAIAIHHSAKVTTERRNVNHRITDDRTLDQAILNSMSAEPGKSIEPPPLPAVLLDPWPIIAVGALAWLVATVAAFVVPALPAWRPMTLAGLGVGVLGTTHFPVAA